MKTTVEIETSLLQAAKKLAREEKTTLRALVEEGLREVIRARESEATPFVLEDKSVGGGGMRPEVAAGGWPAIRALIYEGRGG